MLANTLKQKMRKGQPILGTWMSMGHPSIAEILATAGYDFVVVETEHTAIDVSEVLRLLIAIEGKGVAPLVRLAWNDPIQTKAVLDSGAAGVIVPMVNSAKEAQAAVEGARYPPIGRRGVGLARAQGYGQSFDKYVKRANEDGLLIVQIEHVDAVKNIDSIVAVDGVDGTFIGPYDLSMSMGIPGQINHPKIQAAKERVLKATLKAGLVAGIHFVHPSTAAAETHAAIEAGYRFIALGTDILFLGDSARQLAKDARPRSTRRSKK